MQVLKRVALLFCVGGFVGNVIAMLIGPNALAWFQTPSIGQALCDCARITHDTGAALVQLQLRAMGAGGTVFVVVGLIGQLLWQRRKQKQGLDLVRAGP